jgi:hypothetical protein
MALRKDVGIDWVIDQVTDELMNCLLELIGCREPGWCGEGRSHGSSSS